MTIETRTIHCQICNTFIGQYKPTSKYIPKTCSNACRGKLRVKQMQVSTECKICGAVITTSGSRKRTLCSDECRKLWASTPENKEARLAAASLAIHNKYGGSYLNTVEFRKKSTATKLTRYGTGSFVNLDKAKLTKLERYGNSFYNNPEKRTHTLLQKYGVSNYNQTPEFKKHFFDKVMDRISSVCVPMFEFDAYEGVGHRYSFKCNVCSAVFEDYIDNGHTPQCTTCVPNSTFESEVIAFMQSLGTFTITTSDRTVIKPKELDIYIKEKNLAVECDGVYWHSEVAGGKSKKYHLQKTVDCRKNGIRLLHIFDAEWISRRSIVESILRSELAPETIHRVGARKTQVKAIDSRTSNSFLSETHLQGPDKASIRYGLYVGDELYSVMTFTASRFDRSMQYELSRYATKLNTRVVGGAKKLFTHFRRTHAPTTVVTYSDIRWFTGNVYEQLGFVKEKQTPPNYFYFKTPNILESRLKYQKHLLAEQLAVFDPTKTEWENMKANGYDRIWDCGNEKFIWKI